MADRVGRECMTNVIVGLANPCKAGQSLGENGDVLQDKHLIQLAPAHAKIKTWQRTWKLRLVEHEKCINLITVK